LCSLVGEHLTDLHHTMRDTARALRPGGHLVFTVCHPDLAAAGKEANFTRGEVEYRLGAQRWSTDDYLDRMADAGFTDLETFEYRGDDDLAAQVPGADRLTGTNVLLAVRARRPGRPTSE
jgi:SAM-dependent methyltransferase